MVIILPRDSSYTLESDFPLLQIPQEAGQLQDGTFDDFQWWAYSKDFRKWLEKNPRKWVAESNDRTEYPNLSEYLRENYRLNYIQRQNSQFLNEDQGKVSNFQNFQENYSTLFEDDKNEKGSRTESDVKSAIKFHFAYNKLLEDGTIQKNGKASEIGRTAPSAVFLAASDPETKEILSETLQAFKMQRISQDLDPNSKIVLLDTTETIPGGKLPSDATPESILTQTFQIATSMGVAAAAGLAVFGLVKIGGSALVGRSILKGILPFAKKGAKLGGANARVLSSGIQLIKKTKQVPSLWKGVKSFGTLAKEMVTLKNTRNLISVASKEYKLAKLATGSTISALGKAFSKAGTEVSGKGLGKLIPYVGEVLMVIDAVGSAWNWFSGNQAPMFKEVEGFASRAFKPSEIKIGVPITICWTQPAQSTMGSIVSFFANNDTRTTCELIKIGVREGKSVFIMTQVNSATLQKQLADHDLVLVYLNNSDSINSQESFFSKLKQVLDNDDLDYQMSFIDNLKESSAILRFQGICDWNTFESAFKAAPDQLIIASPDAPETFEFYYKDPDEDVINVAGRLITTEELKNTDNETLRKIFFGVEDKPFQGKYTSEKKNESLEIPFWKKLASQPGIITKFSDFKTDENITETRDYRIFEDDNEDSSKSAPGLSTGTLDPKLASSPAEVMIYTVTEKAYANPELRKYRLSGSAFTNFMIDDQAVKAKSGNPIDVEVNTVGGVDPDEAKKGIYEYKKPQEDEPETSPEPEPEAEPEPTGDVPEPEPEQDLEPVKTSKEDVKIRDRSRRLVIRDRDVSGGVNVMEEFLSPEERSTLGISDWDRITVAKGKKDNRGVIKEVILKNRKAPAGSRIKKYRKTDGAAFEIAKNFLEEAKDRIDIE